MNFFAFLKKFSTEEDCVKHFISVRYPQGATCDHCGNKTTYCRGGGKNFDCKACNNTFSVFKGTIFEKSSTDLRKWFFAIHLFLNGKKTFLHFNYKGKYLLPMKQRGGFYTKSVRLWLRIVTMTMILQV